MSRTLAYISSPNVLTLEARIRAAFERWAKANTAYLQARKAYDLYRLAGMRQEVTFFLAFSKAKAEVKEATDAYYSVVTELTNAKAAVNVAKTEDRLRQQISELEERLRKVK